MSACDIRSTSKSRCLDSAKAFVAAAQVAESEIEIDDHNLRFSDSLDEDETEADAYLNGPEIAEVLSEMNNVTARDLVLMYEGCAYRILLRDRDAPWCDYFTTDSLDKLEYYKDLKAWYESGTPRAGELARDRILSDLLTFDCGRWRFAHAETILPVLNALSLFQGLDNLTAARRDDNRLFRTSTLAPMAANLVATLHERDRVSFALNERLLKLPACDFEICCDIHLLRKRVLSSPDDDSCPSSSRE